MTTMKISRAFLGMLFVFQFLLAAVPVSVHGQDSKEDAEAYYKLGQVYYEQGRYKEAEEQFQKSLDVLARAREKKAVPASRAQEQPRLESAAPVIVAPSKAAVPGGEKTLVPVGERRGYTIGDDDILQMTVWQNPDLDQELAVRPDGMVSCQLIGDVPATGLTIPQLAADITSRLSEYVKSPQVSLSIKKIGGSRIVVLGQVVTPGVFAVGGRKSIMEAVGMAGGFTRDAVPSSTIIIRGGFTGPKAQKVNLSKVFKGDLRENVELQSADIVFVPRKTISDINYFLNQVLEPLSRGAYLHSEVQNW